MIASPIQEISEYSCTLSAFLAISPKGDHQHYFCYKEINLFKAIFTKQLIILPTSYKRLKDVETLKLFAGSLRIKTLNHYKINSMILL